MVRTQIYLTEEENDRLAALAEASGKEQAELIREAVGRLLAESTVTRGGDVLAKAAGMWKDRDDLPDFGSMRRGWDRASA